MSGIIFFGEYDGTWQIKVSTLSLLSCARLNSSNYFQHPKVLFAVIALNSGNG